MVPHNSKTGPMAHLVQLDIAWERPEANHAAVARLLASTTPAPGDLVLLPEMFATGFSFNVPVTADGGATLAFVQSIADAHGVTVLAGRTVVLGGVARNVTSVVAPGGRVAEFAKIHPFQKESEHFEPGHDVITFPWAAAGLAVCPAICYDLRFPEVFRRGLLLGAEVFAVGACWPDVRQAHWRALLVARAIENQAYVLGCNRVGMDPLPPIAGGSRYIGGSIVVSPTGAIAGELGDSEGVLSVEIDPAALRDWRSRFSAWRDMRLLR